MMYTYYVRDDEGKPVKKALINTTSMVSDNKATTAMLKSMGIETEADLLRSFGRGSYAFVVKSKTLKELLECRKN